MEGEMSKEQKTLKSCYILDRLREWFELYENQNHQRAEEELHLAIDELYEYQQKDQQLADLEAKLAESEDCNNMLYKCLTEKDIEIETKKEENAELQNQLTEKDEEIAYLTKQVKKFNNEAQKYFEDAYCNDFHNQDKISFAVEVLKIAQDYVQQYVNNFDDMNDCLCAIDNQIKRLTHQHKDKGE